MELSEVLKGVLHEGKVIKRRITDHVTKKPTMFFVVYDPRILDPKSRHLGPLKCIFENNMLLRFDWQIMQEDVIADDWAYHTEPLPVVSTEVDRLEKDIDAVLDVLNEAPDLLPKTKRKRSK